MFKESKVNIRENMLLLQSTSGVQIYIRAASVSGPLPRVRETHAFTSRKCPHVLSGASYISCLWPTGDVIDIHGGADGLSSILHL